MPFSNNASERDLKCAKGKLKQAGCFRSDERGRAPYRDFLTVTGTARRRGESPYVTVLGVLSGE